MSTETETRRDLPRDAKFLIGAVIGGAIFAPILAVLIGMGFGL